MPGIRRAGPDDLAFLRHCADVAYAPYVGRIGRKPAPMIADFAAHISAGEVWLIEDTHGIPAGYIVMFHRDGAWFIENIAVLPGRHGAGLGRALMAFAETCARDNGHMQVRLYTNAAMTGNLAFYPALGFHETRRVREDGFDRVYFEKTLRPA
ncbi:MAG: GNAT family N-acetyltransferase [Pseudomonadota bacterium]